MSKTVSVLLGLVMVAWLRWDCIVYKLEPVPEILRASAAEHQTRSMLILFGDICAGCPSGGIIEALRDRDIVYVFEEDAPARDIQRFMETFHVLGKPIRDNGAIGRYFRKMARCQKLEKWRYNYVVGFDEGGGITSVEKF